MRFQVYLSEFCPYCTLARQLLDKLGHAYEVIRVDIDPEQRRTMERRSGRTSVPQIFLGDTHIGGYDDLASLHRNGRLEHLITSAARQTA
ncbi:Glutaredoxin 3 [Thioalkalivibrio nitratireducens DSM 14787]|uniref:Glutaredoxin n=1 Tax=Thioalkalivibrio nitratireducens (strain DSM 14787 / UNIQEM 213 / ALEN2) TaxID=1255043 RepID=L0E251_THIND|nr:glutaredoxin 3 [Thioalkalivibrio nitratireducens]AGA35358.1 Glutaredoxin 3 [Thioalkalivibrio nitratireducens DSM 14787]